MSLSFDGASTPWKSIDASSSQPGDLDEQAVVERADLVTETFTTLKTQADALAVAAQAYIDECAAFTTDAAAINYSPPEFVRPEIELVGPVGDFAVAVPDPNPDVDGPGSISLTDGFVAASDQSTAPPDNPIAEPDLLALETVSPLPTYAGDDFTTALPAVPTISNVDSNLQAAPEAPVFNTSSLSVNGSFVTPVAFTSIGELDTSAIDAAKAALESAIANLPELPDYTSVFPEIMTCVGGLLSSFPFSEDIADNATLRAEQFRQEFEHDVVHLWPGGLPDFVQSAQSGWLLTEKERFASQATTRRDAFLIQAANDAVQLAYKLGASAHSMQIDILIGVAKGQLSYLQGMADAMQEWFNASVVAYKGTIAAYDAQAEEASVGYAIESFRVQDYEAAAQAELSTAALNKARAGLFTATEQAKAVALVGVKAELERERAKLQAFDAVKKAESGETAQLQAQLQQFVGRLTEWSAGVVQASALYKAWIARAQATLEQNQSIIESEAVKSAEYAMNEAELRADFANFAQDLYGMQAYFIQQGLEFEEINAKNIVAGFIDSKEATVKAIELGNVKTDMAIKAGNLDGVSIYNSQLAQYMQTVSEAAYRAATQTSLANNTLVSAYAKAQTAAGSAQKSLEAGKWSGWNVTATARATGQLSSTNTWGLQGSTNLTNQVTESDTAQVQV